ncbi:hypothetical protein [Micromonospora zhanjiangensis]|uniref:Uncharacterized protein n=1 Tax=Micromonospora zhanjiangensis TaxID=1522057 RepID=A0ABV8KLE2_9ACTN
MTNVEAKYDIDMSDVRRVERLVGAKLPDILEPLRQVDGDFEAVKASLRYYREIADEIDAVYADLAQVRADVAWAGHAGDSGRNALDWILLVLGWIGAIILAVVAALLMLVALLLYAIGAILQWIGKALAVVAACVAVIVLLVVLIRSGGRGQTGRLTMIWAALRATFDMVYMATLGITGALGDGLGWLCEQAAKGVMWLALWLVEVGTKWTDSPPDQVEPLRRERNKLFGADAND